MAAENFEDMGGAPLDIEVYVDGNDTYYCSAKPWTWALLSDAKFKVMKKTNSWGSMQRIRHAWTTDWAFGKKIWWAEFELPATSLAVVKAYTYL